MSNRPKPTHMKILQGNPGRRPLPQNEPMPKNKKIAMPRGMSDEAKKEWKRITPLLHGLGMLAELDTASIVAYCETYSRFIEARNKIHDPLVGVVYRKSNGDYARTPWATQMDAASRDLRAWAAEFGLTPAARAKVSVQPEKSDDEYEAFLKRGRAASG